MAHPLNIIDNITGYGLIYSSIVPGKAPLSSECADIPSRRCGPRVTEVVNIGLMYIVGFDV